MLHSLAEDKVGLPTTKIKTPSKSPSLIKVEILCQESFKERKSSAGIMASLAYKHHKFLCVPASLMQTRRVQIIFH